MRSPLNIRVTATIKDLVAKIALARQVVASLPNNKTVDIKVREDFSRGLARVEAITARVTAGVADLGRDAARGFQQATPPALGFTGVLSRMSVALRRIPPLLQGIAVVTVATVVPAIIALTAAIAGAVVALAALSAALVAAAGPAIAVFVGAFTSISKVLQVRQLRQQALDSQTRRGASIQRQATAADEARHKAGLALRDAHEQVAAAEEALAEARRNAAQQIADDRDAAVQAAQQVADAQRALAEATIQAYRNMQDAFNEAIDAQSRLAHSRIDIQRQKLNLKDDQAELKKLREAAGLAGSGFDDLFKKFQDVHVDTSGIAAALEKAGVGKGTDPDLQRQIQEQLLKIKEDHLDIKDSIQAEKEAQQQANRAQQDANRFRREGIKADQGYISAVENLTTAQHDAAKAAQTLADAEKQGIAGNPAVLSAQRSLRDARQRSSEAADTYHQKLKAIKKGESDAGGTTDLYREKLSKLTDGQRNLLGAIDFLVKAYKFALAPAVDSVLGGMASALKSTGVAAIIFRQKLKGVGDAWGEEIRKMGHFVLRPDNLFAFADFADASKRLTHTFGGALRSLFGTIINVAQAAMPLLESEVGKVADAFKGWETGTENIEAIRKNIKPGVTVLNLFVKGLIAIGKALFGIFLSGQKPIIDFVKFLADGLESFAKWTRSTRGKNQIAQFFKDTLPFVKSFIKLIIAFGKTFITTIQILFPILEPFLKSLIEIVNVLNFLLRVINFLLGPFKTLIGVVGAIALTGVFAGKVLKGLELIFGALDFAVGIALRALLDFGEKLLGPFRTAIPAAIRLLTRLKNTVGRVLGAVVELAGRVLKPVVSVIAGPFRAAWGAVRGVFGRVLNPLVTLVKGIVSGIGDAIGGLGNFVRKAGNLASKIGNGIKDGFRGVVGFVGRIFDRLLAAVRSGINTAVVEPLNFIITKLNKIHFKIPGFVPGIGGKSFGVHIGTIDPLAAGGLTTGASVNLIGEAGQEAVLPLTKAVFARLGQGIVSAMRVQSGGVVRGSTLVSAGAGGMTHVDVHLPPAPAAAVPDARYQAIQLGRELRRRGGNGGIT
jgi:phage-related protein